MFNEDTTGKIYCKDHHYAGITTILDDLNDRLASPQLMLCGQIEDLLIDEILTPDKDLVTELIISKQYGTDTGRDNVLLPYHD